MNGLFNPGFPLGNGRKDTYIAFFALPFDTEKITTLNVSATDLAGNNAVVPFESVYKESNQKHDTITISDGFLNSKIPEIRAILS